MSQNIIPHSHWFNVRIAILFFPKSKPQNTGIRNRFRTPTQYPHGKSAQRTVPKPHLPFTSFVPDRCGPGPVRANNHLPFRRRRFFFFFFRIDWPIIETRKLSRRHTRYPFGNRKSYERGQSPSSCILLCKNIARSRLSSCISLYYYYFRWELCALVSLSVRHSDV